MDLQQIAAENLLLIVPPILAGARGFVPWVAAELMMQNIPERRRFQTRHIALTPSSVTFAEAGFATNSFLESVLRQRPDGPLLLLVVLVEFGLFAFALRAGDAAIRAAATDSRRTQLVIGYVLVLIAFLLVAWTRPRP